MMHFLLCHRLSQRKAKMFLNCPFLSAVMAGLYFSSSPLRAKKGMGNKGTAVDTLWPACGVEAGEGSGGKKQIECVSTNAAGEREHSKELCNLKSKINDVPIWKGKKKKWRWNSIKPGSKEKVSKGPFLQLGSSQEKWARVAIGKGAVQPKETTKTRPGWCITTQAWQGWAQWSATRQGRRGGGEGLLHRNGPEKLTALFRGPARPRNGERAEKNEMTPGVVRPSRVWTELMLRWRSGDELKPQLYTSSLWGDSVSMRGAGPDASPACDGLWKLSPANLMWTSRTSCEVS